MKQLFVLFAAAAFLASCNNASDTAADAKDSLDSIANEKIENIDSSAEARKDVIDSTTEQKKAELDSLNKTIDSVRK